jgi:hypothetical protein
VRLAARAVVDEVAHLRRGSEAAPRAEPGHAGWTAGGPGAGGRVARAREAVGEEARAPRVAVAVVGVAPDLPQPAVELRVVLAGLAIAEMLPGLGDHRLRGAWHGLLVHVFLALGLALLADRRLELVLACLLHRVVLEDVDLLVLRGLALRLFVAHRGSFPVTASRRYDAGRPQSMERLSGRRRGRSARPRARRRSP